MNNNGIYKLEKTFSEFFAGIGLMRMGLEKAGWKILFANDIDPMKQRIYESHFQDEPSHFVLGDIHNLSANDIPTVSLATASFPCTDLSLAGRREGLAGSQSSALWGFIEILEELSDRKPPIVLLENVEGFLTSNGGKDFEETLMRLNSLGYAIDAFVIDASRFVPQSRVRLFVVGFQFPSFITVVNEQAAFYQSALRPKKLADFIFNHPDIVWHLKDLPFLPKRRFNLSEIVDVTDDDSKEWWSEERVNYLINQTSEKHRKVIEKFTNDPQYHYLTAFRRVRKGRSMAEIRSDGIAGCLRTPKGGSARQILLRVGKGTIKIRFVSPRECARLMGADNFKITGTFNESLFGFGDAVCVPVVEWIANNYLTPLLNELNDSIELKKHESIQSVYSVI